MHRNIFGLIPDPVFETRSVQVGNYGKHSILYCRLFGLYLCVSAPSLPLCVSVCLQELEAMTRYTSPVNPAVFPHLTVVLLAIGMFFTAWFFVYPFTAGTPLAMWLT